MVSGPITSWQIDGETMQTETIFLGSKITADGDCSHEMKRWLFLGRKAITNLDTVLKSRDITLPTKVCIAKAIHISTSRVWMWELDHREGWALKIWCFWITVLKKTLESPLDSKEIKPVNPKRNQPWIFIGRTDAEAPILWPLDARNQLMLGKMKGKRRRGRQRMRWLDCITDSMDMNLSKLRETVAYSW